MAGTWASVAASEVTTPKVDAEAGFDEVTAGSRCAVLDASAVIGVESIRNYADALYTTQEVYSEIQDRHSKQLLASVPSGMDVQEPTAASIAAGGTILSQI